MSTPNDTPLTNHRIKESQKLLSMATRFAWMCDFSRVLERKLSAEKTIMEALIDKAEKEIINVHADNIILRQSRDNWECAAKANDEVVAKQSADLTALRARLAEVEHDRDVALVNEREMATALRKQQDNYNHLTSKIDSWRECIKAAQNRERAALAERDGADGACQKLKDTCEVLTQEIDRLTKDRDDWKAKHWKAHDDFHRQFLEMENLRQQITDATTALRNCALAASAGNTEQIAWIVEYALTNGDRK